MIQLSHALVDVIALSDFVQSVKNFVQRKTHNVKRIK